jgi:FkbM family methyltransferase
LARLVGARNNSYIEGMSVITAAKAAARRWLPTPVWTQLRLLRLTRAVKTFKPRQVVHKYGGREMTIHVTDPLALGWYDSDWPEPAEMTLLRRHKLREGATVFDLGAHQGVVALMLGDAVGRSGKVVALEANPHNAAVARLNRETNGGSQVIVEAAAISDTVGEIVFNRGLNGQVDDGSGRWGQVRVPATTIDALAVKHGVPDVLFIDVEGYELHALRGATKTLESRPDCFVEMHVGIGLEKFGGSVRQVLDVLGPTHDLFMSSDAEPTPVALREDHSMTRSRFFLTAISR